MHDRNFPNESATTRRARLAVNKVNDLQHELHLLVTDLEVAKRVLKDRLGEMTAAGESAPWAEHWERVLSTVNN